jgi:hypothetical protein
MTALLLTLRFLLELTLLVAFGIGGWHLVDATGWQVVLAVALPVLAASVWGLLLSPKAKWTTPLGLRIVIELALFAMASALLWSAGPVGFAVALLVAEVVVLSSLIATGTPPGAAPDNAG